MSNGGRRQPSGNREMDDVSRGRPQHGSDDIVKRGGKDDVDEMRPRRLYLAVGG